MTVPDRPARPKVIVTRELTDGVMRRMEELFEAQLNREDRSLSRDELAAAVADTDVLVPTITDRIDADLIAMPAQSGAVASTLIGSYTRQIVRNAICPVWVLKAEK